MGTRLRLDAAIRAGRLGLLPWGTLWPGGPRFVSRWARTLLLVALAVGCDAPDNALVHGCTQGMLELTWRCSVSAKRLDSEQLATLDPKTKNERVQVTGKIEVQTGEVAIELPGCPEANGFARPGAPFLVTCDAMLNRNTHELYLWARPKTPVVEGVKGELSIRP